MSEPSPPIEAAATLILLQDSPEGPQVLLQQRHPSAAFVGGAWVFPGGKLDRADADQSWLNHVDITEDRANRLLGLDDGALAYWIAALRETVEEAGLLLATQANAPITADLAHSIQQALQKNPALFLSLCQEHRLTLQTDALAYLSRWLTPKGVPKRYDTRFFLAAAPRQQTPEQDTHEVVNTCWITPEQALDRFNHDGWMMVLPTIVTLKQLCGYPDVQTLIHRLGNAIDAKTL